MKPEKKVVIEVMYKANYCLPCFYMDQTVLEILPRYADRVDYRRVDFMKSAGKERFLELSYALYGEDAVRKHCRVAPVPSLFIDGELVFDAIPPMFELAEAIEEAIGERTAIHLEILHEGPHCMPCEYMTRVVEEVAPEFNGALKWEKVVLTRKEGAVRFDELARTFGKLPPVPSLFIDGRLVFDHIPGTDELRDCLNGMLKDADAGSHHDR